MSRNFALALVLALAPLAAAPAAADASCKRIHAHLFLQADAEPTCGSPIGLCATATLQGSLTANTEFVGTSFLPTVDTATTGVVVLTGDNTFHTDSGDFFTKDAIVLSTVGAGEFSEVDVVTGGTGEWAGATGVLIASGTFADGAGEGMIDGQICTP
ncbi:MAG TPA: hypothetical protein VNJ70_16255 [Thermoanaerobaculia bacterium]|nr:hypothetical protein [Thermoanaerobaculia bacterium]